MATLAADPQRAVRRSLHERHLLHQIALLALGPVCTQHNNDHRRDRHLHRHRRTALCNVNNNTRLLPVRTTIAQYLQTRMQLRLRVAGHVRKLLLPQLKLMALQSDVIRTHPFVVPLLR